MSKRSEAHEKLLSRGEGDPLVESGEHGGAPSGHDGSVSDELPANLPPGEYLLMGGDPGARTTASYRLSGADLDPAAITSLTGLQPERAHRNGDPQVFPDGSVGTPYRLGLWSVSTKGAVPDGVDIDEHLAWLLDRLEPHASSLRELVESGCHSDFFVGYFMTEWNAGWAVPPLTLERISRLGAELGLDIYGPEEPDAVRRLSHGLTVDVFFDRLLDVAIEQVSWLRAIESVVADDVALARADEIIDQLSDLPPQDRRRAAKIVERRLSITDEHHRGAVTQLLDRLLNRTARDPP